jgi:hypothetical protein
MIDVIELTKDDVVWPFDSEPFVRIGKQRWRRSTKIDPFPCYSHDVNLVREYAAKVGELWHLPFDLSYWILPFEEPGRTNGWFTPDCDHNEDNTKTWFGNITLAGKRIPPHPAMTRYLTIHEAGHAVEEAIAMSRNLRVGEDAIQGEYAEIRGLSPEKEYGGGRWHNSTCEVLANDFRILVTGVETEFWPHPGIPRPEECGPIQDWWHSEMVKMREARQLMLEDNREE